MEKEKFINLVKEGALSGKVQYGILASLTISQAILESGFGESELSKKVNNLFGIKATSDWCGSRITMPTSEWINGEMRVINAEFRAYESFNDSIIDHSKLLTYMRYEPVRKCTDYQSACRKIYECGYATDPNYSDKLISIIESNKLYEYDSVQGIDEAAVSMLSDKVKKFQHLCNVLGVRDNEGNVLMEDNIFGVKTKACLIKMPVLKEGSKGAAVQFVQEVLNIKPTDGDFGPITKQGIMEYQKDKKLNVDGIVGKQTWSFIVLK